MKIRTVIFLIVIGLGLFPLLVLVGLTLPKTIDRLDRAAELESQARSHVSFTRLNARIRCLKKSLNRCATLPSTLEAIVRGTSSDAHHSLLMRWFADDQQVRSLLLLDAQGVPCFGLERGEDGLRPVAADEIRSPASFVRQAMRLQGDEMLVRLEHTVTGEAEKGQVDSYSLLMTTAVTDEAEQPVGLMVMRIDLSTFLKEYRDSFWVTGQGEILRGCGRAAENFRDSRVDTVTDDCGGFTGFPDLHLRGNSDNPLIIEDENNRKIAWMPIVFNVEDDAVMWVGSVVDESATRQWKHFLLVNVVAVILCMALLVFFSASWLAARIDRMRRDLLSGLDTIINEGKRVTFSWQGPEEVKRLAADLTALSEHYITTCEARNLAEMALRESEDTFRSLTASAQDGIILMDHQGNVAYWNEAATTIFGYTSEEALSRPIHSLIDLRREDEAGGLVRLDRMQDEQEYRKIIELVAKNKDGRDVPVELSLSSCRINNQWHAIWIVRDISERRKSEERARRQQQQLLHADKMISLGLLVSGVAHEINNPNSIALLNLPMLARAWESVKPILDEYYEENGDFTVAGLEYTEMRQQIPLLCSELEESAVRIKNIVKDLKDYARQESSLSMTRVQINEVIRSGVRLTINSIKQATNHLEVEYGDDLPPVLGNRQRLVQVVINLLQNSCEALRSPEDVIRVKTRYNVATRGVEIIVSDTGAGIDPAVINKVTDPFFTTKRTMGGTGLGLSVSAGIIQDHKGIMQFESRPGKGTVVTVSLPAMMPDDSLSPTDKDAERS